MLRGASGPKSSSSQKARVAPPARPARIASEIISEVVEVKTKRSLPGRGRGLEQVARALDVDRAKALLGIADDVGLVQRAGVDHRLDAALGEDRGRPARGRRRSR